MYIPPQAKSLDTVVNPTIRLGIQGAPGTGKTYSALNGFPNVTVADFDNKLGAHAGRSDIHVLPFYSPSFIIEELKVSNAPFQGGKGLNIKTSPPNRRDAFIKFIREQGPLFTPEDTFFVDSWTTLQTAVDGQTTLEPVFSTKTGKLDEFNFWGMKIEYSSTICEILKGLKCNVIVSVHEFPERDKDSGELLSKIQPLMQGKFVCQLAGHFTDWFRQHAIPKTKTKDKSIVILNPTDKPIHWLHNYKLTNEIEYFWQITSDDIFDACVSLPYVPNGIKFIPASYDSYMKVRKEFSELKPK